MPECTETQSVIRFIFMLDALTKVFTLHEVISGVLWVLARHLPGYRVEFGEVVSMEAVVVLQPA